MNTSKCRVCGAADLRSVIDLGHHPLADRFLYEKDLANEEKSYPLRVLLCAKCGYAGLDYLAPSTERYQDYDYSYTSENSPVSVKHFEGLASEIVSTCTLGPGDLVAEIGSNDGTLLGAIRRIGGCRVLGIEPSPNIGALAVKAGIETLTRFLDDEAVEEVRRRGPANVVVTTNVLNHANDVRAFVSAATAALHPDGFFVFEVPYLGELIKRRAFDTVYLEHVSYFGLKPLKRILAEQGMKMVKADVIDYMGGSLRVFARRTGVESPGVESAIAAEEKRGDYDLATYESFMNDVKRMKIKVCREVYAAKEAGERVLAIGAATKGNTFLNYCRLDSTAIDFVTDSSPLKVGKFLPGSHIPIRHDDEITRGYGHALILPWNIAAFLKQKLQHLDLKFITRD